MHTVCTVRACECERARARACAFVFAERAELGHVLALLDVADVRPRADDQPRNTVRVCTHARGTRRVTTGTQRSPGLRSVRARARERVGVNEPAGEGERVCALSASGPTAP